MVSSENKGRCDTCFAYIEGKKIEFSGIIFYLLFNRCHESS